MSGIPLKQPRIVVFYGTTKTQAMNLAVLNLSFHLIFLHIIRKPIVVILGGMTKVCIRLEDEDLVSIQYIFKKTQFIASYNFQVICS